MTVQSAVIHGSKCQAATAGASPYVHWCIYFQLDTRHILPVDPSRIAQSIEFNSQKLQMDGFTWLYIHFRDFHHSNMQTTMGEFEIPMIRVTVQQLLDFVLQRKRDQYRLNAEGSGCRFWCKTVIGDLKQAGWIVPGRDSTRVMGMDGFPTLCTRVHFTNQVRLFFPPVECSDTI